MTVKRRKLDRQQVLSKAIELANLRGWNYLNLHELANELNIKPPSLYNHFKGIDELKYTMSISANRMLLDEMKNASIGKSGEEACLGMTRAYLEFARANPGLLSAIAIAAPRDDMALMQIDEEFMTVGMAIISAYEFDDQESVHALRALRSATHGFAVLEQERGFGIDIDLDISFEWMIKGLIRGFSRD